MTSPAPLDLHARDVSLSYVRRGLEPVHVLRALQLDVGAGELVAVRGASGTGKSTLLHVLGGMLRPDRGTVALGGDQPWKMGSRGRADWRNSQVGFVFQAPHLIEELDALENVLVPSWLAGHSGRSARQEGRGLLERLGLAGRLHHRPSELSGGEAQRVAVARALSRRPRLVLADEPTGNLDRRTGVLVFEELRALQRERRFIAVLATHDDLLARRCDRILKMTEGRVAPDSAPGSEPVPV